MKSMLLFSALLTLTISLSNFTINDVNIDTKTSISEAQHQTILDQMRSFANEHANIELNEKEEKNLLAYKGKCYEYSIGLSPKEVAFQYDGCRKKDDAKQDFFFKLLEANIKDLKDYF